MWKSTMITMYWTSVHHLYLERRLKLSIVFSSEKSDLSDLISRSAEDLQAMREESAASEQKAYEIILAAVHQWEKQAAFTQRIDRAIQYQRIPAAQHTSNEWVQGENGEKNHQQYGLQR